MDTFMPSTIATSSLLLDHVGVSVSDLEISRSFYGAALGFSTLEDSFHLEKYGLRGMVLRHESGMRIELFHKQGSQPVRAVDPIEGAHFHGWFQIAFRVRDVATEFAKIVEAGATIVRAPFRAPDGLAMVAFLADPDGNLIELIERP